MCVIFLNRLSPSCIILVLSAILTCAHAAHVTVVLEKQLQAVFESFCNHGKWVPDDYLQSITRNRGMSADVFVELGQQAGLQRVTPKKFKKVFEACCNQVRHTARPLCSPTEGGRDESNRKTDSLGVSCCRSAVAC